jgi:transposase
MGLRVRDLTSEEAAAIQRLAQSRTAAARSVERARIIDQARQGQSVRVIADLLHLCPDTVRLWLKRFNADGLDGLADKLRQGRPTTYSSEQVGELVAAALTKPADLGLPFGSWTLDRLEVYLSEAQGIPIKRSRIDQLLVAEGLRWRTQETWFGDRASLPPRKLAAGAAPKEPGVAPDFARKRGPSKRSIRHHQIAV